MRPRDGVDAPAVGAGSTAVSTTASRKSPTNWGNGRRPDPDPTSMSVPDQKRAAQRSDRRASPGRVFRNDPRAAADVEDTEDRLVSGP
jgi:hypothetical protein